LDDGPPATCIDTRRRTNTDLQFFLDTEEVTGSSPVSSTARGLVTGPFPSCRGRRSCTREPPRTTGRATRPASSTRCWTICRHRACSPLHLRGRTLDRCGRHDRDTACSGEDLSVGQSGERVGRQWLLIESPALPEVISERPEASYAEISPSPSRLRSGTSRSARAAASPASSAATSRRSVATNSA
jgi:hypothetical protein